MSRQYPSLPTDHAIRLQRARLSLEGLSLGDAFGRHFFYTPHVDFLVAQRALPAPPWRYTDDTVMGLSVYESLAQFGQIDQDNLAGDFARRYMADSGRGYGLTARDILVDIARGTPWSDAAGGVFQGQGSMGNGSAMRVGPVGGFFAHDPDEAVRQAILSAAVTHAHPEGRAGAAAVALACVFAWRVACKKAAPSLTDMCEFVLTKTPAGTTADGIYSAMKLPEHTSPSDAATVLGNGSHVTCVDTVPFCIWCAGRHMESFEDSMWSTVSAMGDMDTTCAIVGSIVALAVGIEGLPVEWISSRESLELS